MSNPVHQPALPIGRNALGGSVLRRGPITGTLREVVAYGSTGSPWLTPVQCTLLVRIFATGKPCRKGGSHVVGRWRSGFQCRESRLALAHLVEVVGPGLLRRLDRRFVALDGGKLGVSGGLRGRIIDIEQASYRPVSFQLDINRADFAEWSVLPGIGETLAKRIVSTRRERGSFGSHEDLLHVRGIGERTLDRIRPYLMPIEGPTHGS